MVDTPIGTNLPTYTLVPGDLGATIYCRVTATNVSGSTNAISNVVGPITAAVAPVNTVLPAIADTTPEVTVAVSCTTGTWTGDPTILYSYQWKRGGTNVGTDSSSYTPVVGDLGATLQCVVTATNSAGSASATSNTTGAVAAAPAGGSTWSTTDKFDVAGESVLEFSNSDRTVTARYLGGGGHFVSGRGTLSHSSGKRYFEIKLNLIPYAGCVGLDAAADVLTDAADYPGYSNSHGFILNTNVDLLISNIYYNSNAGDYDVTPDVTIAVNGVLGFAIDFATRTAWFRYNGTWMTPGDPVAGTGGLSWGATPTALFPYFLINAAGSDPEAIMTIATVDAAFLNAPPTGFTAWG